MTAQLNKNENLIWNTLSTRRLWIKYEYPVSLVFRTECGGDMWQSSSSKISHLEGVIKYSFIHTWPQEAKKFWAGDSPGNFLSISKIKRKEAITSAPIHNMGYVIFSHILTWYLRGEFARQVYSSETLFILKLQNCDMEASQLISHLARLLLHCVFDIPLVSLLLRPWCPLLHTDTQGNQGFNSLELPRQHIHMRGDIPA